MKVLIAVDLSQSAPDVIEQARRLVAGEDLSVYVLHVAAPDPDFVGYDAGPQNERDAVANHLQKDHKKVQELADGLRANGIDATALLVRGPTAETILAQADKLDVEMIVVGSHGKGAMVQLLVGSVSEGVLRESTRPVVVIPTRSG